MAKRFTDTNKYKKPFIRGLKGAYKLLWDYLYHDCDHAGIWIVDFEIAQIYIGSDMPVNKTDAIKYYNTDEQRIVEIDGGSKWFIPSFIDFQYGELNETNRAHNSVINILKKYNVYKKNKGLIRGLKAPMDMDKDKEQDKDIPTFEEFKIYALEKKPNIDLSHLKLKFDAWKENGWKDGNNKKIKNWKSKLNNTIPYLKQSENTGRYTDEDLTNFKYE